MSSTSSFPRFQELCKKIYLDQVSGDDLLLYSGWLRDEGLVPRTIVLLGHYEITGLLSTHERSRY